MDKMRMYHHFAQLITILLPSHFSSLQCAHPEHPHQPELLALVLTMASLRRTKNFATDGQTPIFLYTILKQLDLRSIDWNLVASSLDISNGHAARMRYSRMRQQFDGLSNQPKAPRAKKEKDGENKSSKEKGKGKRLLLEEENERLAKQRTSEQRDGKKPRLEPSPYIDTAFTPSMMNTGPEYVNALWPQPTVKVEPSSEHPNFASSNIPSTVVKTEPGISATTPDTQRSSSPVVKQEPTTGTITTTTLASEEISAVAPSVIKREPDMGMSHGAFPAFNAYHTPSTARGYRLANVAGPYMNSLETSHYMNSFAHPMGSNMPTSAYPMAQSAPGYTYHPYLYHNANPWTTPVADHNTTGSIAPAADNVSLNPLASSYQELLNMPLYVRHSGTPDVQPPTSHNHRNDTAQDGTLPGSQADRVSGLGTKESNDSTVKPANTTNQGTKSSIAQSSTASASVHVHDETSAASVEADSDADCEIDADKTPSVDSNGVKEVTVKGEPVEAW